MLTVRSCRAGALLGAATLYAPMARPFSIQAVFGSELLSFKPAVVTARADTDPRVARALLIETSDRVFSFIAEFSATRSQHAGPDCRRDLINLR